MILEGMQWLGLDPDEGPFYQMQRMDRYREVLAQMLAQGLVYPCYMSAAELDALRERQMARQGEAALRRHLAARAGQDAAAGARGRAAGDRAFATRSAAGWPGTTRSRAASRFSNDELDDLVIARARRHADLQLLRGASTTSTWGSRT